LRGSKTAAFASTTSAEVLKLLIEAILVAAAFKRSGGWD
jgi:hypothetical protein